MKKKETSLNDYIILAGSKKAAPEANKLVTINPNEIFDVTILIRRQRSIDSALKSGARVTHADYEKKYGASNEDINKIEKFAHENHLTIVERSGTRRSIILKGRVKDYEKAFQVHLSNYSDPFGNIFRGRTGDIHIPKDLQEIIEGVFGIDNRPLARPMFKVAKREGMFIPHSQALNSFSPDELAKVYGFPVNVNGSGQCIGIIELGGGYRVEDLTNYFAGLGIPVPSIKAVSIDGGLNSPSTPDSADGEVMLDIEVAGAVAPGAEIVIYFASNTDKGFLDAITTAIHDTQNKPSSISISWGSAENNWTSQSLSSFNEVFKAASLLGTTICAAAGDQGSSDSENDGKVHADFPASSPYVLACGGTRLIVNGNEINSETVWHDSNTSATGGGVSDFFPLPDYQKNINVPKSVDTGFKGRGFPDVAGNADPETGYKVLVDGQEMVIGGTSAVAPLMAALISLINQQKGKPVGFIHPVLYSNPQLCRDITTGDNITTSTNEGYKAGPGWDACTGWGVLSKL